jgi:hypothetical protein
MRSAVAKKTEIYCALALYRSGGTRSEMQTLIHAAECFWPSTLFMVYACRVGPENRNGTRMLSAVAEITVKHCAHAHSLTSCRTDTVFHSFLGNH